MGHKKNIEKREKKRQDDFPRENGKKKKNDMTFSRCRYLLNNALERRTKDTRLIAKTYIGFYAKIYEVISILNLNH